MAFSLRPSLKSILVKSLAVFSVVVGVVVGVVFFAPSREVSAHAVLVNSVPASGATVAKSPTQVLFDFDEEVETTLGYIKLYSSDGERVMLPDLKRDISDTSIVRVDVPELKEDTYVAAYRVISADGHPIEGAITFRVGEGVLGDVTEVVRSALENASTSTSVLVALAVSRFFGYLAVALLLASIFLASTALRDTGSLRKIAIIGSIGTVMSNIFLYLLQGLNVTAGSFGDVFNTRNLSGVFEARVGQSIALRIFLSLVMLCVVVALGRRPMMTWLPSRFVAVFVFFGLPLTYSYAGHASAGSPAAISIVASALHVASVATWFGGLVILVLVAEVRTAEVVTWFSKHAVVMIAVAVATGVIQAYLFLGGFGNLGALAYGKTLVIKVIIVGAMLLVAALVRKRFHESGVASLRALLIAEAVVGVLILGVTAGLVGASPRGAVSNASFSTTLVQGEVIASITVSPVRVGESEMHVILSPPNGALSAAVGAKARLSLASSNVTPIQVPLSTVGPNHYVGLMQLPFEGKWQLDIIVNITSNSEVLYRTTFQVR